MSDTIDILTNDYKRQFMNLPLKRGDKGENVKELQGMLIKLGYKISIDGDFGGLTQQAVADFQAKNRMTADGIVGDITYNAMMNKINNKPSSLPTGFVNYPLLDGQFIKEVTAKIGLTLHHTVSDGNPYTVVDIWNKDNRGGVGTHYVVGREMVNGDKRYNGLTVECVPLENWIHHIATTRIGKDFNHTVTLNRAYVGIELCSWGCLKKEGTKFFDLSGSVQIPDNQVCELHRPFRTYRYWHKYTDEQLHALIEIARHVAKAYKIDFTNTLKEPEVVNHQWFEMDYNAIIAGSYPSIGRKLTTHTNFEDGKFDCFPQPELMEVIRQIYKIKG